MCMARSAKKRKTPIALLFWIAVILLVLVVFLSNRTRIQQVIESTGLLTVLDERFNRDEPQPSAPETTDSAPTDPQPTEPAPTEPAPTEPTPSEQPPEPTPTPTPDPPEETAAEDSAGKPTTTTEQPSTDADVVVNTPDRPNVRRATLYFIRLADDGRVYPENVIRTVRYGSSPLTETIRVLLSGPTTGELADGLLNLIPEGTELISARVEDGVAYLNFNDQFRFNPMGLDGVVAQLKQIIYSATEFSTVNSVQFLVEGRVLEYLGGEGVYVGAPLDRNAFS